MFKARQKRRRVFEARSSRRSLPDSRSFERWCSVCIIASISFSDKFVMIDMTMNFLCLCSLSRFVSGDGVRCWCECVALLLSSAARRSNAILLVLCQSCVLHGLTELLLGYERCARGAAMGRPSQCSLACYGDAQPKVARELSGNWV